MRLVTMKFSASQTTAKVVDQLCTGLGLPRRDLNLNEGASLGPQDCLIAAFPVFSGRLPAFFKAWMDQIQGRDTPAVAVVVYGNRAYEDALLELSESIKQYGVLQPLLVSDKKDYFEIIAGERRWRAAKMAGLKEVPVVVKEFTDQEIVEISLIENIQREDLNPIEEAMAYKRLMEEFHLKQDEIADRVAKSRTAVTNSMRLLKLSSKVQEMVIADMISAGHARALLGISDEALQETTAMKVFDEKLSVRETEKLVKNLVSPAKKVKTERNTAEDAIYESLEEKMKGIMGTKVSIQRKKNNKGKIEIEYYSRDELERIIDLFESIR